MSTHPRSRPRAILLGEDPALITMSVTRQAQDTAHPMIVARMTRSRALLWNPCPDYPRVRVEVGRSRCALPFEQPVPAPVGADRRGVQVDLLFYSWGWRC